MMGAVVHDGHIWIIGAENPNPDDVWKSPDGKSWELVAATVPWPERANQLVGVFDGSLWVMGGQTSAPSQTDFVADLKVGSVALSLCTTADPRNARSTNIFGTAISEPTMRPNPTYLKAGKPFVPAPPPLSDVWRSDDGASWELVTERAAWAPRGMITGANGGLPVHQGRMWVIGGGCESRPPLSLAAQLKMLLAA